MTATEKRFQKAMERAEYISAHINWTDALLKRVNDCLFEKDGEMTRERFTREIAKRIFRTGSPVNVTHHGENTKLDGILSISTIQTANEWCKILSKIKGSICESCYAKAYIKRRPELRLALCCNYIILTQYLLEDEDIPKLRCVFARIESFGDLEKPENGGITQSRNYVKIIKINYRTKWEWHTKHKEEMQIGINLEGGKPDNLKCVYSSLMVNEEMSLDKLRETCHCIDSVFTVYDSQYIAKYHVNINCGSNDCWNCARCYLGEGYIREKKK